MGDWEGEAAAAIVGVVFGWGLGIVSAWGGARLRAWGARIDEALKELDTVAERFETAARMRYNNVADRVQLSMIATESGRLGKHIHEAAGRSARFVTVRTTLALFRETLRYGDPEYDVVSGAIQAAVDDIQVKAGAVRAAILATVEGTLRWRIHCVIFRSGP